MKGSGVFTLRSFHASSGPPPDLNSFTCPNCNNKVDKDRTYDVKYKHILPYFKGTEGVPAIFLEYYPKISVSDFRLIKKDGQFLERKARVCDTCYIELTQVLQSGGTRSKPKNSPPKMSRSLSSSGNAGTATASHSPSLDKLSSSNGSPPPSPLFSRSPKAPTRSSNTTSPSSSPSISPSSSPVPTRPSSHTTNNHSSTGPTKKAMGNGNYKDSYYLTLYEELDGLRKELNDLKTQEESAADQIARQLKEKEEELRVQKKTQANRMRQETQQRDEQIKELQETIKEAQREHQRAVEAVQREFEKKFEHKVTCFEKEKEQLEATVARLKQEKADTVKQSEAKIETDRNEVLAGVEKLKQKFDMEKVVEREQLKAKCKEEVEIAKKKQEVTTTALRQQVSELENELAKEKREKERVVEEKKELTRLLELAKAKSRVEGKA